MSPTLEVEEWRAVPGFEGTYSVSSSGRVRRDCRGVATQAGRILKSTVYSTGYRYVVLYRRGIRNRRTVHSLVALAFIGPRPAGHIVNHDDGDKTNCRLSNLYYTTDSGNKQHAFANGLMTNQGSKNSAAKLSEEQVYEIRSLAELLPQKQIALIFGVQQSAVSNIVRRKTWGHLL